MLPNPEDPLNGIIMDRVQQDRVQQDADRLIAAARPPPGVHAFLFPPDILNAPAPAHQPFPAARPIQHVLRPVFQQLPVAQNEPGEDVLDPRPCENPVVTENVVQQVLLVSPDVNRQWLRSRAGHGAEFLVDFIYEHYDRIPMEPGAGNKSKRIMDVSLASVDASFAAPLNDEEAAEEEIRERKINALIVYIKQLDKPKEPKDVDRNDFFDYVKRRYPTIRCNVITQLRRSQKINEIVAICELIAMKALTKEVASELHMENLIPANGQPPWLTCSSSIKARKNQVGVLRASGAFIKAHKDVDAVLQSVGPNAPEVTCAVCYDDFSKKRVLPCSDKGEMDGETHYVCHECIRGQARALCTDGQLAEGGQGFLCVDPDCKNVLPWANVKKVLQKDVRKVLSKRLDNEAILALEGLESCNYCSFQMLIEASTDELKVFSCQKCRAEFCRICKKDWRDHIGKKCDEMKSVEDKKEEARKKLEEELAMAIMRKCHRCRVVFAKDEGCNKMTCRCGATQCYMCRAEDISYKHFCPHVRDPNQPNVCPENCPARCLLWVKTDEIDNAALNRVKAKALTDRALHEIVNHL